VPIYVYRCECGLRFERLTSVQASAPACPDCGGATQKIPAGFSLGGRADSGLSMDRMPQTWRGVYAGNREYLGRMRRQWEQRQRLEAKYPEIAGDQRPILAHEGRYHDAPLRAGDPIPDTGTPGHEHRHGHGHGHGHGPGHGDGHGRGSSSGGQQPAATSEPKSGPSGSTPSTAPH
jgi:putative FmdB family regulatory protein